MMGGWPGGVFTQGLTMRLLLCREKKAGASKKGGEEQAKKQGSKPVIQQHIADEADAKLSFGRIEIDKGKVMYLNL